mgnify:CR=1 FL=1
MAKGKKTVYFCQNCGHEEAKWLGQCPMCKEWNTFVEERIDSGITKGTTVAARAVNEAKVVPITEVSADDDTRNKTGIKELDRVLGGGIVPGSLVLVGGDPGIGKSSLRLRSSFVQTVWVNSARICCFCVRRIWGLFAA